MATAQGFFSQREVQVLLPRVYTEIQKKNSDLARARRDLAMIAARSRGERRPDFEEADTFVYSLQVDDPRAVTTALRREVERIRREGLRFGTFGTEEAQDAVLLGAESGRTALDTQLDVERELQEAQSRAEMGNDEILNAYSHLFGVKL